MGFRGGFSDYRVIGFIFRGELGFIRNNVDQILGNFIKVFVDIYNFDFFWVKYTFLGEFKIELVFWIEMARLE